MSLARATDNPFETNYLLSHLLCMADRQKNEEERSVRAIRAQIATQGKKIATMEERLQTLNDDTSALTAEIEASRRTLAQCACASSRAHFSADDDGRLTVCDSSLALT